MSHFTVLVRLPATTALSEIKRAVASALLPYKEAGCGAKDPPELKKHLVFEDVEDDSLKQYDTDTTRRVRLSDGKEVFAFDDMFRNHDFLASKRYIYPPDAVEFERPVKEIYPTFEQYMAEYCGYEKRDQKTGRYGHWRNPNQKWDWFEIGGRWIGSIPVKDDFLATVRGEPGLGAKAADDPNKCDGCRIKNIDMDAVATEGRARAEEFWTAWTKFVETGKSDDPFYPRERAVHLGLLECKNADELKGDEFKTIKWGRQNTPGVDRFDVIHNVTREEAIRRHEEIYSPIRTYALLDGDGWHSGGEMGWFGCSSDTPESKAAHARSFMDRLRAGDQRDWVVVVDCHI